MRFITQHREYAGIVKARLVIRSEHFYAAVHPSNEEFAMGITISRKVGKAHTRNLLKRRIKAWVRLESVAFPPGYKLNLVAKPGAGELTWLDLCNELSALISKLATP